MSRGNTPSKQKQISSAQMEEQKRYNEKVNLKNFQKYLKNLLTNQSKYVIMNMFFERII